MRIVFQGDSITDCGRQQTGGLGNGYVSLIASRLASGHEILNRGISGNRIVDLEARWKTDTLDLKPDLISILIGVNDTWHQFSRKAGVDVTRYGEVYASLLEWTKAELPEVRLVLCEPFVLPCGVVEPEWRDEIDERGAVVGALSEDYGAVVVPFQWAFDEALDGFSARHWAVDGIHPTPAGHALMADLWMRETAELFQ